MEHQLWKLIVVYLQQLGKLRFNPRQRYSDLRILEVYFWSVLHDRPVCWACCRANWPIHLQKEALPSNSCMSRRLRSALVKQLLAEGEARLVRRSQAGGLVWFLDGKPLTISGCSRDRQAGYGRAASCKAKGYKLHALVGADGTLAAWRLAPMNTDERVMAERMLQTARVQGYIVTDCNYDSNRLHAMCNERNNRQMVTPRRYGKNKGTGHRRQTTGRLRSKAILENPFAQFGEDLQRQRGSVERFFGNVTNWGGGLTHLPPWVRTYRRVHRWVQAKILLYYLRISCRKTTCAA